MWWGDFFVMRLNLENILKEINYLEIANMSNCHLTGISYHSGKVMPGDIFFCIKGYKSDGHKYAKMAVEKGAMALVVEEIQPDLDIPQVRVPNSRIALAHVSSIFYGFPSKDLSMVGVTGTNGKTTTTFMIDKILEKAFKNTGLIGTVVIKNGQTVEPAILTTPESLDLQKYLWEMKNNNISHATMEVSSSGLDLHRVGFVDYDIAVVNNISRDHIDLHGSFENYMNAKMMLVQNLTPDKFAILNGDCADTLKFGLETKAKILTIGFKNQLANVVAHGSDLSGNETSFMVTINHPIKTKTGIIVEPQSFPIKLQVLGLHNIYNSLMAITVSLLLGVEIPVIQRALYEFIGVERRFQLIFNDKFKIIDDHYANPGNITVTMETVKHMNYNRFNLIYGVRGSRGTTVNTENALVIANWAKGLGVDHITLTTSEDYVTPKDIVTPEELDCVEDVLQRAGIKTTVYSSLKEALYRTIDNAQPDDLILLGGCQGMDPAAKVVLEYILQKELSRENLSLEEKQSYKDRILSPLSNRVAGM